ncbi:MAG: hypothetical protein ACKVU1_15225 [bacterium]
MRFFFDWMIDHRFTDFLKAKRDLFLFDPDAKALERFHATIRELLARIAADEAVVKSDQQRAFFLRRFAQELEPLLALACAPDLAGAVAQVEERLTEIQDRVRAYSR